jgi:hypothetical protein
MIENQSKAGRDYLIDEHTNRKGYDRNIDREC